MPALDGLRGLAVLSVIAYHLHAGFAPGGLLGVDVFFVISGYLITGLLVAEWQRSGRIDLRNFWLRRARRLFPALFIMLFAVAGWVMLCDHARLLAVRNDIIASIAYVSNWWFIFHDVSYFASFGPPSPLGHLWSLAVEEQFYLLWPLLLLLGLRFIPRRRLLIGLILAGAAASALAMALLYQPGTDPSRVYYGTDTRAFALLIGAALALVWPGHNLPGQASPRAGLWIDLAGCAGLLTVLLMIWRTDQYDTLLYRGLLLLLSIAAAVLVAALAHPSSRLGKALGWEPLRWLGVRSYGLYLWHYPVITLTSPVVDTSGVNLVRAAIQVAASIALAALSWRLIEEPIRRGALESSWRTMQGTAKGRIRWGRLPLKAWIASAAAVCAICIFCAGAAVALNDTAASTASPISASASTSSAEPASALSEQPVQAPAGDPAADPDAEPGQGEPPAAAGDGTDSADPTAANPEAIASGQGITAIGDSVLIDAAPDLGRLLPGIVVDAEVGRQLADTQVVVNRLQAGGQLGSLVIIELGTNGPFTGEQLESLIDSLGPVRQVVLVNTRVPRPWEGAVNSTLAQVSAARPEVILVDWYAASAGHDSYFYQDGVHLTPEGSRAYAALAAGACIPDRGDLLPGRSGSCPSRSRPPAVILTTPAML